MLAEGVALLFGGDRIRLGGIGLGSEVGTLIVEDKVLDDVRKTTVGREAYIYIIIIICIELEEPIVLVVLQAQVDCCEWCGTNIHTLSKNAETLAFARHRVLPKVHLGVVLLVHTFGVELSIGIVGVFSTTEGSHGVYRKVRKDLVRHCEFYAVVLATNLAYGEIGESEVGIVVERCLLDTVDETCIVSVGLADESIAHLYHPGDFTAQD